MLQQDHFEAIDKVNVVDLQATWLQEIVFDVKQSSKELLGLLFLFFHFLRIVDVVLEQVEDTEERQPSLIICNVEKFGNVGHDFQDLEEKTSIVLIE